MSRLKTLFMYVVWVVVFFIFSQIMIYIANNTTYKYRNIEVFTPIIVQAEVQTTSINGIAKCKIVNNTQENIENKYIKLECYSKNDVLMGTKYIEIDKILTNEEKEFEIRFNYSKVDNAKIQIIDELPEDATQEQTISDPKMNIAMVISSLILLFSFA